MQTGAVNGKEVRQRGWDAANMAAIQACGHVGAMAKIYASRGVTPEALSLSASALPKKETLAGCMEAGEILAQAVVSGTKTIVVGDYDSDGSTASALLLRAVRQAGGDIEFIVPNRVTQGYGLSPEIARAVHEQGAQLLITVDNGIASVAGVAEAKRLGLTVLVTDHHLQGDALPDADCIVNPNLNNSTFTSRLAGVGVAFYVAGAMREALCQRGWVKLPNLSSLLDIVAVGTVGDLVPFDLTNRTLIKLGMDRIRRGEASPGIAALLSVAGKNYMTACAETAGFVLAPRINAAGRLATADVGIRMLATDSMPDALRAAQELDQINRQRRQMQHEMSAAAIEMVESINAQEGYTLTVFDPSFHEGIVGLIASHLKEKYNRPSAAFALAEGGGLKGSFRSIPGVHIRDVIDLVSKRNPGLVVKFGGHAMAAGATLESGGLERFRLAFELAVVELAAPGAFNAYIETDGELDSRDIGLPLAEKIAAEHWGQGFPAPVFEGTFMVKDQRPVGTEHLRLYLANGGQEFGGIFFRRKEPLPPMVRAVYRLDINEYRGNRDVQLVIEGVEDPAQRTLL